MNLKEKFEKDKFQGDYYEMETLKYLDYDKIEITKGYFKEYDIIYWKHGMPTKIEVKSDRLAYLTGNICIEYQYKNEKSGIDATTADYYYYYVLFCKNNNYKNDIIRYELYKIPVEELKKLCIGAPKRTGGDNRCSKMYLINLKKCEKYKIKTHKNI